MSNAPQFSPGDTFTNGTSGLHANGVNWHERCTIVKRDPSALGTTRYIVATATGRHTYAFGSPVTD